MRRVQRLSLHPFELLLISGAFAMPIWVACTEFIAGNRYLPTAILTEAFPTSIITDISPIVGALQH